MNIDWKEALGQLMDSAVLPDGNSKEGNGEDNVALSASGSRERKETLRVVVDKKGRKGKTATIVEGFTGDDDFVADVAKRLKQKLGTGGSSRGGEILIQGDRKADVERELQAMGHKIRK